MPEISNSPYVLYFNYIAILLQTMILIVNFIYNNLPARTSRLYKLLAFISLTSGIFNTLHFSLCNNAAGAEFLLPFKIILLMNGVFTCLLAPVYFMFTISLTHEQIKFEKYYYLATFIPLLVSMGLTISSPFTHLVGFYDDMGLYHEGKSLFITYGINIYYIFFANIHLICHRDKVNKKQLGIVSAYTIILIISIAVQFCFRRILIVQISTAISIFLMYFSIRNPSELMDRNSGCYNRTAFKEVFFTRQMNKKRYSVGIVHITNMDNIKQNYGTSNAFYLLRQTIEQVSKVTGLIEIFYLYHDTFVFIQPGVKYVDYVLETVRDFVPAPMSIHSESGKNSDNKVSPKFTYDLFKITDLSILKLDNLISNMTNPTDKLIDLLEFTTSNARPSEEIRIIDDYSLSAYQSTVKVQQSIQNAINQDLFTVYFQPIYDISSNRFTGAESLLRLKDDEGTFIQPTKFIHQAELNGTILTLGDISLRKTCEYIKAVDPAQYGIKKININLSIIQCMKDNIASHLLSIIDEYEIPHKLLRFEITETLMATEPERLKSVMSELTSEGIEFALDDYGTGYSNTSRLLDYPFAEIKFDKSFVDSAMEDEKNSIPLKHLMNMVKDTGRIVLVEGVETKEMAEMVKKYGGDLIQGFYYAHPLPQEEFINLLEKQKK